jgi:hypothetical protein
MDISIADVQELALENFLLRRDLTRAQAVNEELRRLLEQAAHPSEDSLPTEGS